MGLKDQLNDDLKTAMKAKDETRVSAIRMLKAALANYELARTEPGSKDAGKPITESDLIGIVEKQIKQRRESIELYQKANRPELAAQEQAEIAVLEVYMPKQLSRDEIKREVEAIIAALGVKEFPKVMKESAMKLKGRADGKTVNEVVRELVG
ncbi:MAG: GatB/YqeY domain-containing protein [Chloroflexi bacterium]|nr:GatB/YqeY domain-containing protein [Chloroflexota bacterium]